MEILKFKLFCVEMYKLKYNMSGKEVINLFNKYDVLNFIEDIYAYWITKNRNPFIYKYKYATITI